MSSGTVKKKGSRREGRVIYERERAGGGGGGGGGGKLSERIDK